jgi:biotin-dependent carboxylase-like uncharacterized protein
VNELKRHDALEVIDPGFLTLIVDQGRPGGRALGVPVGGAADRAALALGNALVGNPANAAALEINVAGPRLRAHCNLACVLFGAPFEMQSQRQRLEAGITFTLQDGEELNIGPTAQGLRGYFCVKGGIHAKSILGSRSSLGPVDSGDKLACQRARIGHRFIRTEPVFSNGRDLLHVVSGPQADWFPRDQFLGLRYRVTASSNRMGLRLAAEPLPFPSRELVSEPVAPGAVQVTSDGQCIILGVDGQTIGGYPKIAHVISADLDRIAQLRPDEEIHFALVGLEEARRLYQERVAVITEWVTRLAVSSQ